MLVDRVAWRVISPIEPAHSPDVEATDCTFGEWAGGFGRRFGKLGRVVRHRGERLRIGSGLGRCRRDELGDGLDIGFEGVGEAQQFRASARLGGLRRPQDRLVRVRLVPSSLLELVLRGSLPPAELTNEQRHEHHSCGRNGAADQDEDAERPERDAVERAGKLGDVLNHPQSGDGLLLRTLHGEEVLAPVGGSGNPEILRRQQLPAVVDCKDLDGHAEPLIEGGERVNRIRVHAEIADQAQSADRHDGSEPRFVAVPPDAPQNLETIGPFALGDRVAQGRRQFGGFPAPNLADRIHGRVIERQPDNLYLAARDDAAVEIVLQPGPDCLRISINQHLAQRIALRDVAPDLDDELRVFAPSEIGDARIGNFLRVARVERVKQLVIAARHVPADAGGCQQHADVGDREHGDDTQPDAHGSASLRPDRDRTKPDRNVRAGERRRNRSSPGAVPSDDFKPRDVLLCRRRNGHRHCGINRRSRACGR